MSGRPGLPAIERFWDKVQKTESCWLWTAYLKRNGYGQFFPRRGHPVYAHRYSYELARGAIPDGLLVLHACDNPRCVNPNHLSLGTQKENLADMRRKGRHPGTWAGREKATHCRQGHPYTLPVQGDGGRRCLVCFAEKRRRAAERQKQRTRDAKAAGVAA
jgi:hypothetical protein